MAKRIEHSRRHGHYDPRWTRLVLVPSQSSLPVDELEQTATTPPKLALVGGTDLAPAPLNPLAPVGT